MQNALIGQNVFDRDVKRAGDLLGFDAKQADWLRKLAPGEFYAFGPALAHTPVLLRIDPTITTHTGSTPELLSAADLDGDERKRILDVEAMCDRATPRASAPVLRGNRALDCFLLDEAAGPAARIVAALRRISPNATTSTDLTNHLGISADSTDAGLDLLASLGAVDTEPRREGRIARLSPRLRVRTGSIPVVGLA